MKITSILLLSFIAFQEVQCHWNKEEKAAKHKLKVTKTPELEGLEYSPITVLGQIVKKKEKFEDKVVDAFYDAVAKLIYVVKAVGEKKLKFVNKVYNKFNEPFYAVEEVIYEEVKHPKHGQKNVESYEEYGLQDEDLFPYKQTTDKFNHGSTKTTSAGHGVEESSLRQKGISFKHNPQPGGSAKHSSHRGDSFAHSSHSHLSNSQNSHTSSYVSVGQNSREGLRSSRGHQGVSFGQPYTSEEEAWFGSGDGSYSQ